MMVWGERQVWQVDAGSQRRMVRLVGDDGMEQERNVSPMSLLKVLLTPLHGSSPEGFSCRLGVFYPDME